MRIAVTGASGLVGGQVVRAALLAGHDVRALVRRPGGPVLAHVGASTGRDVEQIASTLTRDDLHQRVRGCEGLVHCAAVYDFDPSRAAEVERTNVAGTRTVIEAAAAAGVRRVVVTSSSVTRGSGTEAIARTERDEIGDEPRPTYYASKLAQEDVALHTGDRSDVEVVLALPTVVLGGPAARLLPSNAIVLRYLLDVTRSTYPGGCNVVDAREVGAGHLLLLERGSPRERYLLGGQNVTWRALHTMVAELAGLPRPRAELPSQMAYLASAAAELWGRVTSTPPLSTRDEAGTVGRFYWYDDAEARALGYASSGARPALAAALAWLVVDQHVPRWLREGLRLRPQVRAARPLAPAVLAAPAAAAR